VSGKDHLKEIGVDGKMIIGWEFVDYSSGFG
jgi:hypothetical protein